jgi:hypothetical protein
MTTDHPTETGNDKTPSRPNSMGIFLLGIVATIVALSLGVFVGGPLIRLLLGPPVGFHEDFTSMAAYRQALIVQFIFVALVFLLLGIALGQKVRDVHLAWTLWVANPITVGTGFVIYSVGYRSLPGGYRLDEYYNVRNGVFLAIAAPFLFGLCFRAGAHLSNHRLRRG